VNSVREWMRGSLARGLRTLPDEDRLAAAWPVACGPALAARGRVVGFEEGVLTVAVTDARWREELQAMRFQLAGEVSRISGVRVEAIHFELKQP
jgi:predicted nucleic acid-binding Zn ribbon protein